MAERRTQPAATPLNPPDVPLEQLQIELEGRRLPENQSAFIDPSDVDTLTRATRSDIDGGEQGEPEAQEGDELLESLDPARITPPRTMSPS